MLANGDAIEIGNTTFRFDHPNGCRACRSTRASSPMTTRRCRRSPASRCAQICDDAVPPSAARPPRAARPRRCRRRSDPWRPGTLPTVPPPLASSPMHAWTHAGIDAPHARRWRTSAARHPATAHAPTMLGDSMPQQLPLTRMPPRTSCRRSRAGSATCHRTAATRIRRSPRSRRMVHAQMMLIAAGTPGATSMALVPPVPYDGDAAACALPRTRPAAASGSAPSSSSAARSRGARRDRHDRDHQASGPKPRSQPRGATGRTRDEATKPPSRHDEGRRPPPKRAGEAAARRPEPPKRRADEDRAEPKKPSHQDRRRRSSTRPPAAQDTIANAEEEDPTDQDGEPTKVERQDAKTKRREAQGGRRRPREKPRGQAGRARRRRASRRRRRVKKSRQGRSQSRRLYRDKKFNDAAKLRSAASAQSARSGREGLALARADIYEEVGKAYNIGMAPGDAARDGVRQLRERAEPRSARWRVQRRDQGQARAGRAEGREAYMANKDYPRPQGGDFAEQMRRNTTTSKPCARSSSTPPGELSRAASKEKTANPGRRAKEAAADQVDRSRWSEGARCLPEGRRSCSTARSSLAARPRAACAITLLELLELERLVDVRVGAVERRGDLVHLLADRGDHHDLDVLRSPGPA